jgi:hypothetical protein
MADFRENAVRGTAASPRDPAMQKRQEAISQRSLPASVLGYRHAEVCHTTAAAAIRASFTWLTNVRAWFGLAFAISALAGAALLVRRADLAELLADIRLALVVQAEAGAAIRRRRTGFAVVLAAAITTGRSWLAGEALTALLLFPGRFAAVAKLLALLLFLFALLGVGVCQPRQPGQGSGQPAGNQPEVPPCPSVES